MSLMNTRGAGPWISGHSPLKGFLATRARGFGEWGRVEAFETAAQAMREGRQGPSKA